jgi:hypothetical protein
MRLVIRARQARFEATSVDMFNRDSRCTDKAHRMMHYAHCETRTVEDVTSFDTSGKRRYRGSVMDYHVEEIQPGVWRVEILGMIRIIRRGHDMMTFAPWDIFSGDGHRLWAAPSLESAFRWIQARTGLPTEALLAEGLLAQTASHVRLARAASQDLGEAGAANSEAVGS